jgi:hypothetical protein
LLLSLKTSGHINYKSFPSCAENRKEILEQ